MRFVTVLCALAGLAACGAPALAQGGALQDEVRRIVNSRKLGAARVGIVLYDTRTNTTLASMNSGEQFIPASNMKLLTSGAAVMVLGPDFAFRTELALDGDRLIVRGAGDPSLGDPEVLSRATEKMTVDDVLGSLAESVTRAGQRTLREVVVDDRVFDREFVHPTWNKENLHQAYSAQVAGLNFHANVLNVFPEPGQAGVGSVPAFTTQPAAAWLRIDASRARTGKQGAGNSVWLVREGTGNNFVMRGEVSQRSRAAVAVTINNPPEWFGQLLATSLVQGGVQLGGAGASASRLAAPQQVRVVGDNETLPEGRTIAVVSTPLEEVLRRCNVDSENLYAESLLKRMGNEVTGKPGSWTSGGAVMRMMLSQELGPEAATNTIIADGSGLSRENRVTPMVLARWLDAACEKPWGPMYVSTLAGPGQGTLERRFQNARLSNQVRAKSGYIKGVRALSGYVSDERSGDRLVFVVLVNDLPLGGFEQEHNEARRLHEEVVQLLDRTLEQRARAREPRVGG